MVEVHLGMGLGIALPLLFWWVGYRLLKNETLSNDVLSICAFWGFFAATPLSAALNEFILFRAIGLEREVILRFFAPVYEEIFKGLILIFFFMRSKIENRVDGALYGISVGVGFALFENIVYVGGLATGYHIAVGLFRGTAASLGHMLNTGLIGFAAGWSAGQSARTGFFRIGLVLIISCLIHLGYNNSLGRGFFSEVWHLFAVGGFWVIVYAVFLFILRREAYWLRPAPDPAA